MRISGGKNPLDGTSVHPESYDATKELLAKVNEILAKAYENGYYDVWYEEALALAEGENAADVSYDDEGNVANG